MSTILTVEHHLKNASAALDNVRSDILNSESDPVHVFEVMRALHLAVTDLTEIVDRLTQHTHTHMAAFSNETNGPKLP